MAHDPRLVEMVARAICAAEGFDPDSLEPDGIIGWMCFVHHAEAAIAVINRSMNPQMVEGV